MPAYYNEVDSYAARWLRHLIAAGLIAPGEVDERSIVDIDQADLDGYTQCHFFAGIGGWSYALRLAGWPDERPCFTGSCPCQPLSSAGQRNGHADERHLWPAFHALIAERRPATIFGEQVAGALGREWLSGVRADLENAGYAIGAADLCAAGAGAPHIRQRLFWVADAQHAERWPVNLDRQDVIDRHDDGRPQAHGQLGACGEIRGLGDADRPRSQGWRKRPDERADQFPIGATGESFGMGNTDQPRCQTRQPISFRGEERSQRAAESSTSFWSAAEWLQCLDGKARRVEPGIFPLAHGVSARVGKLRGAGNAIVPQAAAAFVAAFMDAAE